MPIGAGLAPAGSSLAGYGVVDSAPQPGVIPLPDPKTGLSLSGRYIDQTKNDYTFTTDGRLVGWQTVPQLVLLAIKNNIDFSSIQVKGPNFKSSIASLVQNALHDLITSKQVLLQSVSVTEPNPDAALILINWLDLTTGEPQQTTV